MPTPRPFRFGVINEQMEGMASSQQWRDHARKAEDLGYATFLIRDHFVAEDFAGEQFGPIAALMAAANATKNLRIGSLVFSNDFRHPVMLAKEAATLDLFSDGRFELGLGAGWMQTEYDRAGMQYDPPGVRISRMAESIQILKGLFGPKPLTFSGEHYQVTGLQGFPQPLQRPHPPLLIGGGNKRMLMLAGQQADIVSIMSTSVRAGYFEDIPKERLEGFLAQKIEWIRAGAGERFANLELNLIIDVIITNNRHQAAEQLIHENGWQDVSVEETLAMPAIFLGTVDEIVATMELHRQKFGISYYIVSDQLMDTLAPVVARLAGK